MTRAEDLSRLSPRERLQLLRFVVSFAWSDLAVTPGERAYVHGLVSRLHLTPDEALEVEGWLKLPPSEDDVDPTTIPHEHRRLFLDAVREMLAANGGVSPEEKETLSLLEQLTR
ncbi:MAG TPA: TerB family tellurite resistance protein [Vicinamibacteria bacterium]|nr:TerB family tellurite resistance protein [Vicinamibacteria bacterium]